MLQQQASFDQLTDEYAKEKWLEAHTIHISEWNSYCLAACIGTYLTERFLEGTFSAAQEATFLNLFNNIFATNFNERNRDALHAFLASCNFSYVQQMMAIMVIKTYKETKDNEKFPKSVFNNINNKVGEGLIKFFFQNYFPDIGMVKVDELNPDWDSLMQYKDNKDICVIIDRKKEYEFNVDIMSLTLAKKNGTLSKLENQDNDCQPTIIIDRKNNTIQRWVNHHGKWLKKDYKHLPKNFIYAWKQKNNKDNDKDEIAHLWICTNEDRDFMASDTGHTLKKERAAHFELFTNYPKKAQSYNALSVLYEYPLGNLLPDSSLYGRKIPRIRDADHLSDIAARQGSAKLYLPDRIIDDTRKCKVYTIPIHRYETLPNLDLLKKDLGDKPALLVVADEKNYMFWGKKNGEFSAKPLELSQYNKRNFDNWTQHFNQILVGCDKNTILDSLSKLHEFDKKNLSKSEHFIVRPRETEEEYFKYVTNLVSEKINFYINKCYMRFCQKRKALNTPKIEKKYYNQTYKYQHKSPKKKHQTAITDKKASQKIDSPTKKRSGWTYAFFTIAFIFTGIIPGLLVLAGYGIYKLATKEKKKLPDGSGSNRKDLAKSGSTGKVISKTVENPKANSLLSTTPVIDKEIKEEVPTKLPPFQQTTNSNSDNKSTEDNAPTIAPETPPPNNKYKMTIT